MSLLKVVPQALYVELDAADAGGGTTQVLATRSPLRGYQLI